VAQTTFTLLSLTAIAVGPVTSATVTLPTAISQVQLTISLGVTDLISAGTTFTFELWRLDPDSVWRIDLAFTFIGAAILSQNPTMTAGIGNLAGMQVKGVLTNTGALMSTAIATLVVS